MPPVCTALLRTACVGVAVIAAHAMHAQLPTPPATTEDALRQMLAQSGIVFTGQITDIRRIEGANGSSGLLEIEFAVNDAILGVAPDSTYTLREWAGLAPNSDSTFLIGRRYLMFLHAPGPGGLSSPVGGPDGAIPIVPMTQAAGPNEPDAAGLAAQAALAKVPQIAFAKAAQGADSRSAAHTGFRIASADDSAAGCPISPGGTGCKGTSTPVATTSSGLASAAIDLRWIAARVLRPVTYAPSTNAPAEAEPILTGASVAGLPANLVKPASAQAAAANSPAFDASTLTLGSPAKTAAAQPPTTTDSYANLLTLLRSWAGQDHAAR